MEEPTEASSPTTTPTTAATPNYYLSTLARELTNQCLQHSTSNGDLNTGGLGSWVFLQYQLSFDNAFTPQERWTYLQSAKDAALEALKTTSTTAAGGSQGTSTTSSPTNATTTSTRKKKLNSSSTSIFTNERIGAYTMLAAIYHALDTSTETETTYHKGKVQEYTKLTLDEIETIRCTLAKDECELLYGRAGAMQAIYFLRNALDNPQIGVSENLGLAVDIVKQGQYNADQYQRIHGSNGPPLVWNWQGTNFLGAAHGCVGILMSLLGMTDFELDCLENTIPNAKIKIRLTIDALEGYCYPSGNLRVTMNETNNNDRQVQWAHGAPGYVWLLVRSHQVYVGSSGTIGGVDSGGNIINNNNSLNNSHHQQDTMLYLTRAKEIAENVLWARRKQFTKSLNLTQGLAGIAYVFVLLAQTINNDPIQSNIWKQRAEQVSRYTVNNWKDTLFSSSSIGGGRPYSLMEGLGGLVCLLLSLGDNISTAQFPFFYHPTKAKKRISRVVDSAAAAATTVAAATEATTLASASGTEAAEVSQPIERHTIDRGKHDHFNTDEDSDLAFSVGQLEDYDEFKDSSYDDMPVSKFLVESMRSLMTSTSDRQGDAEFNGAAGDGRIDVTAANLDEEIHQDLVDLMVVDEGDSDYESDAFEVPIETDQPNSNFLRRQDSQYGNGDLVTGDTYYLAKPMLDDEKHKYIPPPSEDSDDDIEYDEFETGNEADAPNSTYLRAQDSTHSRDFFETVVEKPILDDEKHNSVTAEFHRGDSCGDFDDFEPGNLEDAPVPSYLQKQVSQGYFDSASLKDSNKSGTTNSRTTPRSSSFRRGSRKNSPQETRQTVAPSPKAIKNTLRTSIRSPAEAPTSNKVQSPRTKQISGHQKSKEKRTVVAPSPVLESKSPNRTQTKQVSSTPTPTKEISPNRAKQSPGRTPIVKKASTPTPTKLLSPKGRASKLQKLTSLYMQDCLEACRGEGNISTGGLGTSVYLRIKQSECEDAEKSKASLETALDHAMAALRIAEQRRGKVQSTLLCGEYVGSKCLIASILYRLEFQDAAIRHGNDVLDYLLQSCSDLPQEECSLMHGRAGMLQAIWFLRRELNDDSFGRDLALALSSVILLEGTQNVKDAEKNGLLLMWKWRDRSFLGAATGVAGVLYSLLGHSEEEWSVLDTQFPRVKEVVKSTIDGLERHKHESGNLRSSLDGYEEDKLTDWSHGSPGYCMLLLRAHEVYKDENYLQQAKCIAEKVIWPRRMQRKNLGILKGVSGNAYILLGLARADPSSSEIWINRVQHMVMSTVDDLKELISLSKRPNSLLDGLGGFVSLLIDLQTPERSHIPFIEASPNTNERYEASALEVEPAEGIETDVANGAAKFPSTNALNSTNQQQEQNANSSTTAKTANKSLQAHARKASPVREEENLIVDGIPLNPRHQNLDEKKTSPQTTPSLKKPTVNETQSTPTRQIAQSTPRRQELDEKKTSPKLKPTGDKARSTPRRQKPDEALPKASPKQILAGDGTQSTLESQKLDEKKASSPKAAPELKPIANQKQTQSSPRRQKVEKKKASPKTSPELRKRKDTRGDIVHDKQMQEKNIRIARQQMKVCLANATASGNLMKGGLGQCVFLRLKSSETLENKPGGNRIQTLKAALRDAEAALSIAENQIGTFHVSVFTGEFVGAKCLLAAILFKLGQNDDAYHHVSGLLFALDEACSELPSTDCDIVYGRAGALQAIWFLRRELGDPLLGRDFVLKTSQAILMEGIANGRGHKEADLLLVWKWRGKPFLGAAHGSVGVLHSLLGHTNEEWVCLEEIFPRVKEVVHQSIRSLERFRHPSGNLRVTCDGEDEDNRTEWAHGSPGYCLLLVRAFEVFDNVEFLNLATDMAEKVLWPRRMQGQGLGLARGISGTASVFLILSRADPKNATAWKTKAELIVHAAVSDINSLIPVSNRPYSLYEGLGGFVSLLMDIASTESGFPFFESRSERVGPTCNPNVDSVEMCREASPPLPNKTPSPTRNDAVQSSSDPGLEKQSARAVETQDSTPAKSMHMTTANASPKAKPVPTAVEKPKTPERTLSKSPQKSATTKHHSTTQESSDTRFSQQDRRYSTPERQKSKPMGKETEKLVVTPVAMRRLLFEPSSDRQQPSPARSAHSLHIDSEGMSHSMTPLAHQLITACLQRNKADGNIYSGGIGPGVFLQSKLARHLMENQDLCQIKAMRPLKSATDSARKALADAETRKGPFHPSILTGEWVGAKCLLASVLYNSGNIPAARQHGEEVIEKLEYMCAKNKDLECDLMYGRAGALQAVWYLRQELEDPTLGRNFALSTSLSILMEGLQYARGKKNDWLLLWAWKGQVFLGAANGVAGILHAILGHNQEELDLLESHLPRFRDAIKQTINNLHKHRHPSGNLRATLNKKEEDRHYEWAHGCAGYLLLLMRASEVLKEPRYLELAKEMAMSVLWPRRAVRLGVGLSRGLSGIGYVFLGLARLDVSNREEWIGRAQYYVEAAVSNWGDLLPLTNRPYSLYEGLGGLANLILDMENVESGHFPFFETGPGAKMVLPQENRSVKFSQAQTPAKKTPTSKTAPSDDIVTASTVLSTRFESPDGKERKTNSLLVSPLTDPNVTPAKDRLSPSLKKPPSARKATSGLVFPEQRKMHKHTKPDNVSVAVHTVSSRAKFRVGTPERKKPDGSVSPSVRRIVGGFRGSP